MTSIIKVNNLQNQCGANTINKCGTAITVGASGDTVTLAAGASQSGFGQTYSAVSWDTTPKTTTVTGVAGVGYFVNTTAGAVTANLPAGTAGDVIAFADYTRTFQTNNLTITPNGSEKIGGIASNFVALTEGQSITLVYVDATEGWINTAESTGQAGLVAAFIVATSPCVATVGDYKIHTFTGPGTFCVSCAGNPLGSGSVDYMVVAGGGGGGENSSNASGGGAGAGGYRESSGAASGCYTASPLGAGVSALPVSVQGYSIAIGGGGTGGVGSSSYGTNGAISTFSSITSAGGGFGGSRAPGPSVGNPGGSGGGGGLNATGGTGNTPPVSPPQGQTGGGGTPATSAAGGGGAGAVGGCAPSSSVAGPGGAGATTSINATPTARAGGGGGGGQSTGGTGGTGGGGAGATGNGNGTAGTTNTGGGGGGAYDTTSGGKTGGLGGSGIVIIRYKFQ